MLIVSVVLALFAVVLASALAGALRHHSWLRNASTQPIQQDLRGNVKIEGRIELLPGNEPFITPILGNQAVCYESVLIETYDKTNKNTHVDEQNAQDFFVVDKIGKKALVRYSKRVSLEGYSEKNLNSIIGEINPIFTEALRKFGIETTKRVGNVIKRTFIIRESWMPPGEAIEVYGYAKPPDEASTDDTCILIDPPQDAQDTVVVLAGRKPTTENRIVIIILGALISAFVGGAIFTLFRYLGFL